MPLATTCQRPRDILYGCPGVIVTSGSTDVTFARRQHDGGVLDNCDIWMSAFGPEENVADSDSFTAS